MQRRQGEAQVDRGGLTGAVGTPRPFRKESLVTIETIAVAKLVPHPDNPRLFLREDVVNAICKQIRANGGIFEERYAPHVRRLENGTYQIVGGHQRIEGAKRADVEKIPCFVVEMTDEEALSAVLLSNAQGELSSLEIGLHVRKIVERSNGGRGKKGGISEYAEKMGATRESYQQYVNAARVAAKHGTCVPGLIPYTRCLSIIHRAPESDWSDLVGRMLAGHWTTEQTERYVEVIKALKVPEDFVDIFPRAVLIARFFQRREFSAASLDAVLDVIRRTEDIIRSYAAVIDADGCIAAFRTWLKEGAEESLDVRQITRRQRELLAEFERAETEHKSQLNHGDWREFVTKLQDESLASILTDPPYGIHYQSNRAVARDGYDLIPNDGSADAVREIEESFRALYPKLRPDGHALCFCGWRMVHEVCEAIVRAGYEIRNILIWVKDQHGSGDLKGSFAPKHELIIYAVKGSPDLLKREPDVLECARVTKSIHPAEKPVELLARLIEATTIEGDRVADPFAGIASTLVAAKQSGRRYWGCEVDTEYFQAGEKRLTGASE